ncbi:MAG: arsenate reductase ArsC [Anaerolineaceae bacterium]
MATIFPSRKRVLFLCIGNSCRSQIAEALLRKHAADQFVVFSAGLEPSVIHPYTIRVLEEIGIDASEQFSKSVAKYFNTPPFDYIITVCDDARESCPIFPGPGERIHWTFEDPVRFIGSEEQQLAKFREVRDLIDVQIRSWLKELAFSTIK